MKAVNEITEELTGMGSMLAELPRAMPYSVPDGYFEQLPGTIQAAVEMESQFAVPAGYFDSFPEQMLAVAKRADKKPILISLANRVRWVAAAVLIMCIGVGSYMTFQNQPAMSAERILSSVPASEIQEYLQGPERATDEQTANHAIVNKLQVDSKEIVSYLNETGWE